MNDQAEIMPSLPGEMALNLLQTISDWGNTTTIILHGGCVFEFKGPFPKGSMGEGFYNLKGETGFEGHLNLDKVSSIKLVSRPHRGRESHSFVFLNENEETMFKIFLGRDPQGELLTHQLESFNHIKKAGSIS